VALNLYHIRVERTPAGDFFRSIQRQRPAQYQGLYLVTPDGKVLASHQDFKPRPHQAVNSLPYRGLGTRADGSITPAVSIRYMFSGTRREGLSAVVLDSLTLTREDQAALAPPKKDLGTIWTVPEGVSRKFFPVLSPTEMLFRDPHEVTAVRISGKVRSVENGIVQVIYEGQIAGVHHGTADEGKKGKTCRGEARLISGVAALDAGTGKMRSMTLVFSGMFSGFAPYDKPANPYGAVVEWRQTVTVSGTVRFGGRLIDGGTISFTPINGEQRPVGPSAKGRLREGKYSLTGVMPGMNRVHVQIGEAKEIVTGRISLDGRPVPSGSISLVPVDKNGKPSGAGLKGAIQDGRYQVKGVAQRNYQIVITGDPRQKEAGQEGGQSGRSVIPDGIVGNDQLIHVGGCDQTLDLDLRPAHSH
jgi:hypothetical protein